MEALQENGQMPIHVDWKAKGLLRDNNISVLWTEKRMFKNI